MLARRDVYLTLIARYIGHLEVRMVAHAHGHRIARLILQQGFDFERSIHELVRHLDRMREGKLRHQLRVAPEFQAAGDARGILASSFVTFQ